MSGAPQHEVINKVFRNQLLRFAPAALVDSQEFLSIATAVRDEAEQETKEPTWGQQRLLDIARMVGLYDMVIRRFAGQNCTPVYRLLIHPNKIWLLNRSMKRA